MTTQTEELYDVVIYEKATRKIDAIIGTNMKSWDGNGSGRNTAELRVQTGQERINERYECEMVAAGKYKKGDVLPERSRSAMSAAKQTPKYLTDDERRSFAASPSSALGINDTDRLNALITLFGGHYAIPAFWQMAELFKDGRRGLDAFLASNPSLLGSKAPNVRLSESGGENKKR